MCFIKFQQLAESLDAFGQEWKYNPGDGAFYGPKVCVTITTSKPKILVWSSNSLKIGKMLVE